MAQDVARLIWKMAHEDVRLDQDDLKYHLKKKIKQEKREKLEKLKEIIRDAIDSNSQETTADRYLILSNDDIEGSEFTACVFRELDEDNIWYYYLAHHCWVCITDRNTVELIESAIIPLDLRWDLSLSSWGSETKLNGDPKSWERTSHKFQVSVSWDHWPTE